MFLTHQSALFYMFWGIPDIGGKTKCVKMNETLNQWKAL